MAAPALGDSAGFSGTMANYTIAYNSGTQTFTVTDIRGGSPDGTDTITNTEIFRFSDGTITYDLANLHPWFSQAVQLDGAGSTARR